MYSLLDEIIGRGAIIEVTIIPLGEGILKIFREFAVLTMVTLRDEHGAR